ncbi:MAG: patatin family protein [Victivallaceae bacterium]|nr:patatin family protein [Victivallaceae bacterium]
MKKGLILEGGAMRALFSCGVLDVLMQNGVRFDGIVGVSAGAAFGCNYKSHQPGRALRYNLRFCRDKRYCSFHSLLTTGDLYGGEFCYHLLPETLDPFDAETFRDDPTEFFVTATDVDSGEPRYRKCVEADPETMEWLRASASMPGVSRPVHLEERRYLDGGISDPIPLRFFESLGYDRNVLILTRPRNYRKKTPCFLPLLRPFFHTMPAIFKALEKRANVYNATLDAIAGKEKRGEIFVIRPEAPLPSGKIEHDPRRLQATYDLGKAAIRKEWERLKAFLSAEK